MVRAFNWLLNIAIVSMFAYACVRWYGVLTAPEPEYFVREDGSTCIVPQGDLDKF